MPCTWWVFKINKKHYRPYFLYASKYYSKTPTSWSYRNSAEIIEAVFPQLPVLFLHPSTPSEIPCYLQGAEKSSYISLSLSHPVYLSSAPFALVAHCGFAYSFWSGKQNVTLQMWKIKVLKRHPRAKKYRSIYKI